MNTILLVLPSTTYRTQAFMAAAAKLNLEIIIASDHRQALAALLPDHSLALNFSKPDLIRQAVSELFSRRPFVTAIGVDDRSAWVAAVINEALRLPGNTTAAAAAAANKFLMRQKLAAAGLKTPAFQLCPLTANPQTLAAQVHYPAVLKPLFLSASRGVTRVNTGQEFVEAFHYLSALLAQPELAARAKEDEASAILAENYIPGIEVAVEGILTPDGFKTLAIFDKPDPLEGPHFVETIYCTPSRLPAYVQREVIHESRLAAAALGLESGPVHAELRINEQGAWVVEIAGRSIGGLCSQMLRFQQHLTLEDLILRQALEMDISAIQREQQAAAVMMIPVPEKGILQQIDGIEDARGVEGIENIIISVPTGQPVEPMPHGGRYPGFIFARATMPEEAETAIRRAYSMLTISITAS